MIRNFLSLSDAGPDGIAAMLADALDRKVRAQRLAEGQSPTPMRRSPATRWRWCSKRTRPARG